MGANLLVPGYHNHSRNGKSKFYNIRIRLGEKTKDLQNYDLFIENLATSEGNFPGISEIAKD
jgi:hypothetical protein